MADSQPSHNMAFGSLGFLFLLLSFIYLFIYLFICLFICLFIYLFLFSFSNLIIYLFIYLISYFFTAGVYVCFVLARFVYFYCSGRKSLGPNLLVTENAGFGVSGIIPGAIQDGGPGSS